MSISELSLFGDNDDNGVDDTHNDSDADTHDIEDCPTSVHDTHSAVSNSSMEPITTGG